MKPLKERKIDILYIDHAHDLYAYAIGLGFDRETAMDAIHDVFYKLCSNPDQINGIDNVRYFLMRSLRNRLIDILRLKKDQTGLSTADAELAFTVRATIEDEYIRAEEERNIVKKINNMLSSLTDRQKEIIYLRYMHGHSYEEISQIMNITVPACRKLIHKSLSKLKNKIDLFSLLFLFA